MSHPARQDIRLAADAVIFTVKGEGCLGQVAAAPFVAKVEKLGDAAGGFQRLAVHGKEETDVSVELFRLAVEKGWLVSELRAEAARLEEVFARLTRG